MEGRNLSHLAFLTILRRSQCYKMLQTAICYFYTIIVNGYDSSYIILIILSVQLYNKGISVDAEVPCLGSHPRVVHGATDRTGLENQWLFHRGAGRV